MLRSAGVAVKCIVIASCLCAASACSGSPTSPTDSVGEIASLWKEGQSTLLQLNEQWLAEGQPPIRGNVLSVKHTHFDFISHRQPLLLDGERVAGYFEPSSRIHYHEPLMHGAIPHEAGHAILYKLKDPRWHCVGHPNCHP
jgi:hypothetical protein